jgi:hypothetical protein
MSHAPTFIAEWLRPALRRGLVLVGIFALLVAAASTLSTLGAAGLFDEHRLADLSDCQTGGDDGCASNGTDHFCSLHGGSTATGVLPAGPVVSIAPSRDWAVPSRASVAGWADFPAEPPPISLS